jgi:hypothetical protein
MKFYRNFIVVWSFVYLTLAFSGRFFSEKKEWFPFFRWSLYSKSYDTLEMSYVMVSKFGDSVFLEPKELKDLRELHKLSDADIFEEYLKINNDLEESNTFNNRFFNSFFPEGSEYIMYKKQFDLSKEDYSKPIITKQLEYKNEHITIYD